MKLALVYNVMDSVSGETVFAENIIRAMEARGFDITLCAIPQAPPGTLYGRFEMYSRFPLLANTWRRLKALESHDVLHFLNASLCPAGRFLKNKAKIATTHFSAASYLSFSPPANPVMLGAESLYAAYVSLLERAGTASLDILVATSPYYADYLEKVQGIGRSKIRTILPGMDTGYFRKLETRDLRAEYGAEEVIAYLGRLHERSKGVSYLIRAVKSMQRKGLKLLIVGDGPDEAHYRALVKKEGLGDSVHFLGRLDFHTKSVIQKSADAVVMPSLYEVFGTVFAECLACGTPVVAFDLPFWKGLYEGAGIFAKPRDVRALAAAVADALDDTALRKRLIARGKRLSAGYDLTKVVAAYAGLYEELGG